MRIRRWQLLGRVTIMIGLAVNANDRSGPQRPMVNLEVPAPAGSKAWMEQLDFVVGTRDARDHGPEIGSVEWKILVSRKLGVYDAEGHGPDVDTEEWRSAVHRMAFELGPAPGIVVVYRSASGQELRVTFDSARKNVTLHTPPKDIILPQGVSASGARYVLEEEEFWNKGIYARYRKGGVLVFEGNDLAKPADSPADAEALPSPPEP